jgi:hypothetical protein
MPVEIKTHLVLQIWRCWAYGNNPLAHTSIIKQWYREQAKTKFAELAKPLIARFEKYIVLPTGIFIQKMLTR